MAQALTNVTQKNGSLIMCYVDDVVIAIPTLEDLIRRLDEVFAYMKQESLKCKPLKCEILRDSIKYLGRLVDKHGVRPDPEAVEAVLTWNALKTDTQLMTFLGFASYYREFIKGYADKIYPMRKLTRNKGKKFSWTDKAQVSFENIQRELCEALVLGMPTKKGMFVLDTDASVVTILGILHQEQEWNGRTVLRPFSDQGSGPRHADRKGNVRVRHGCLSGYDIGHTSPRTRVEWENRSPTNWTALSESSSLSDILPLKCSISGRTGLFGANSVSVGLSGKFEQLDSPSSVSDFIENAMRGLPSND